MTRTVYELSEEDFELAIERKLGQIMIDKAFARFEGREVSSSVACEILGVTKRTLYRYIGSNLITPLERQGEEEYRFNLRELLEMNVLKHKHIRTWKSSQNLSRNTSPGTPSHA